MSTQAKSTTTRYVLVGVRTLVDPNDPADVEKVHALQDAIKVDQPGGPGTFEVPNWDHGLITMAWEIGDLNSSFSWEVKAHENVL